MSEKNKNNSEILEFKNVSFGYQAEQTIIKNVNLKLIEGKTYALVGPTGGGKTTTAGLMVRLFDPTEGVIEFRNRDIRAFMPEELSKDFGYILQEPFLFTGTIGDNLMYGYPELEAAGLEGLKNMLKELELDEVLTRFPDGLQTEVSNNSENISLGQKQLVAFTRILLRKPSLLIMDEATANIDTVTELWLNKIIARLPKKTTKVIIAHRLNTIKDADEILFINNGKITAAMDFEDAIKLIESAKRNS
jgi:ATP-binding cassette, subfamily B, bacterial